MKQTLKLSLSAFLILSALFANGAQAGRHLITDAERQAVVEECQDAGVDYPESLYDKGNMVDDADVTQKSHDFSSDENSEKKYETYNAAALKGGL